MFKKILIVASVGLVCVCTDAAAQDIFNALKQVAEMENEQEEAQPDSNQQANNSPGEEQSQQWEEAWKAKLNENAEVINAMNSPDVRCVAMMVLYVYDYVALLDRTDRETDCKLKYDLYGMQLLSMASSTTIMYCPEGLAAYSDERLGEIDAEYMNILFRNRPDDLDAQTYGYWLEANEDADVDPDRDAAPAGAWARLIYKTNYLWALTRGAAESHWYDDELFDLLTGDAGFIRYLIGYFTPNYIAPRTFSVAQSMEELGCSD